VIAVLKEILNSDGQIHGIRRWAHTFVGYQFAMIHCSAWMMQDVDMLSRCYEGLIHLYMFYVTLLSATDHARHSTAYDPSQFPAKATKCPKSATSPATWSTPCLLLLLPPPLSLTSYV
jgi:hypothetical protein